MQAELLFVRQTPCKVKPYAKKNWRNVRNML
jgi:hypothetical protein